MSMTGSMRICMLLDRTFPPDPRVANEARSLVAAGHDVTILCVRYGPEQAATEVWQGIRLRRFSISRAFHRKASAISLEFPFYRRFLARMLAGHLGSTGADIVHAHDLPTVAVGLAAARTHGALFVADLHENWPAALRTYGYARRFPGRVLISPARWARHERHTLPQVDRILVVIEEAKKRLVDLGIPAERISVVRNTVHVNEFEGFPEEPHIQERFRGRFVLTYLGGFERHRGIETVLNAMPLLMSEIPEAMLLLVGGGSSEAGLRRLAARLGVTDQVVFEGWQPFSRFPSYIRSSDVCLIPHLKTEHTDTTIPHKLFHYMLLGRPVLTTDCEPLARIVRETGAGVVVPSGDAGAFARAAAGLRDARVREKHGVAGRAAVMDRYRWEVDAEVLASAYADLARVRRRSSK